MNNTDPTKHRGWTHVPRTPLNTGGWIQVFANGNQFHPRIHHVAHRIKTCSTPLYTHTNTNNINKTWPSYIIVMVKYYIILLIHTVYSSSLVSQEELGKLWIRLESFFSYIDKYHLEWLPFLILIEIIYIIPTTRHRLHESVSLIGTITF